MKFLLIFFTGLMCWSNVFSQEIVKKKYYIEFASIGGIYETKLIDVVSTNSVPIDERYLGLNFGFKSNIIFCFKKINTGFGISIRKVKKGLNFDRLVDNGYNTFKPALFGLVEFKNKTEEKGISLEIRGGIINGTISDNYKLFVQIGPKFKLGKPNNKINVCIHPSFLYQMHEKTDKKWPVYGSQTGISYEGIYRTIIFDFGIIIQFNKFENPTNLNE